MVFLIYKCKQKVSWGSGKTVRACKHCAQTPWLLSCVHLIVLCSQPKLTLSYSESCWDMPLWFRALGVGQRGGPLATVERLDCFYCVSWSNSFSACPLWFITFHFTHPSYKAITESGGWRGNARQQQCESVPLRMDNWCKLGFSWSGWGAWKDGERRAAFLEAWWRS